MPKNVIARIKLNHHFCSINTQTSFSFAIKFYCMKKLLLSLALSLFTIALFAQAPRPFPVGLPQCLEDDFRELEKFYDATGGDTWKNQTGWLLDKDMSKWQGIGLTADSCDVASIGVFNNNLIGSLVNFNLPKLQTFFCHNNQLTGTIPNFDDLPNLQFFSCLGNQLIGTIPNFDKLPNLQTFSCSYNQLIGTIPNFDKLPNLTSFDCSQNQLSGTIPNFDIPNLQTFYCTENQLSGVIPIFDKVPNLQNFYCRNNQLTGTIPNFDNLPKLQRFDCSHNQLIGIIPNFDKQPWLFSLVCHNNQLSGVFSPDFKKKTLCEKNYFNFGSFEKVKEIQYLVSINPQKTILPLYASAGNLIADVGGSHVDSLTYQWFRNGIFLKTTIHDNKLPLTKSGQYYYTVKHKRLPQLTLRSDTLTIGAVLKGNVFEDSNKNCALDGGEKGYKSLIMRFINPKDTVTVSADINGNFTTFLDTLEYKVFVNTGSLWKTCNIANIKPSSTTDTITLNIPMQVAIACAEMHVNLSTMRLRRCFDNIYSVNYCNKGTIAANDAYVEIDFDKSLIVKASSIAQTLVSGNKYRFNLGKVEANDCSKFNVTVTVDCDSTVLGQTHCTLAHIYPDSLCYYPPTWDKSSITVNANCKNGKVNFEIKNVGISPTSQPLQYFVIEDQIVMRQSQPFNLNPNEVKLDSIAAMGKTYRLLTNQSKSHPSGNPFVSAAVEGCGTAPFSMGFLTQFADEDGEPYLDMDCRENIGSYDPNSKEASPRGATAAHLIEQNTDIEYQINFQNYGSDTAFTVVIRDTLDNNLNINTLELGASSHAYTWSLENRSTLKVIFDKINLTTQKQNDSLSQGYVRYRIAQNPDLPYGTSLTNRAGIYFDFNKPIMTNQTFHKLGKFPTVLVSSDETTAIPSNLTVKVMPNPFKEATIFKIEGVENEQFNLELFDIRGMKIYQQYFIGNELLFDKILEKGFYFYQISGENGSRTSGRVLVM